MGRRVNEKKKGGGGTSSREKKRLLDFRLQCISHERERHSGEKIALSGAAGSGSITYLDGVVVFLINLYSVSISHVLTG